MLKSSVGKGGVNRPEDVSLVDCRLCELGFAGIDSIHLFQAVCRGYQVISGPGVDGRVDPGGFTEKWLWAGNAPAWGMMPNRGAGFLNAERFAVPPRHEYGTIWMAKTLIRAARDYAEAFPGAPPITLRHVSLPKGGPSRKHKTHQAGLAADLRVPRNDKSGLGTTWNRPGTGRVNPRYNREAMRAMLVALTLQPLARRVLFNDPVLIAEGLCVRAAGHDDHAHFEIHPPERV